MTNNYTKIIRDNLQRIHQRRPQDLVETLPAVQKNDRFMFKAFGQRCEITPNEISVNGRPETGVPGILISLYALHVKPDPQILQPLKSFKDFPNCMPYVGAFTTHTESILVPHVTQIETARDRILQVLDGEDAADVGSGDFSFLVRPLPKISLCYIIYHADEDFPASVTCLFSNNALNFMPIDGLADVGEYTSRKILELIC
jgi:hypothetical protein